MHYSKAFYTHRTALVLASMSCKGQGERVQRTRLPWIHGELAWNQKPLHSIRSALGQSQLLQSKRASEPASECRFHVLKSLVMMFLAFNSAAAFNPSLPSSQFSKINPTRNSFAHLAMMSNSDLAPPAKSVEEDADLQSLTVKELQARLKALKLKVSGRKADLVSRLEEYEALQQAPTEENMGMVQKLSEELDSSKSMPAVVEDKVELQAAETIRGAEEEAVPQDEGFSRQAAKITKTEESDAFANGPPPMAERWYVDVPSDLEDIAKQASRSVLAALSYSGRLIIETAAPELDTSSQFYSAQELMLFVGHLGDALGNTTRLLPRSMPNVKLLFPSMLEATIAGAAIQVPSLTVSAFGHASSVSTSDGAFVVVSPTLAAPDGINCEAALDGLLQEAGRRPVLLINPRLGNSPILSTFEQAYLMRPLSLTYVRDESVQRAERVTACMLRCYPHEWGILYDEAEFVGNPQRSWRYAGGFRSPPRPEQIETVLAIELSKLQAAIAQDQKKREEEQGSVAAGAESHA